MSDEIVPADGEDAGNEPPELTNTEVNNAESNNIEQDPISETADDEGLVVNSTNFEQIAARVVEGVNLDALEQERRAVFKLLTDIYTTAYSRADGVSFDGLTLASESEQQYENGSSAVVLTYTCNDGGSLTLPINNFNSAPISRDEIAFKDCSLNGQTYNGTILSSSGRHESRKSTFNNYSRNAGDKLIEINGSHDEDIAQISWVDTSFSSTDGANNLMIDNINWLSKTPDPFSQGIGGFVLLPDGTYAYAYQVFKSASLEASFNITSNDTPEESLTVLTNLTYGNRYFEWQDNVNATAETPTYPVSDLGPMIDLVPEARFPDTSTSFFKNSGQQILKPQWNGGEISISATDNSHVLMRPNTDQIETVLFELNGSAEQISRLWADGFQINCPTSIGTCGLTE